MTMASSPTMAGSAGRSAGRSLDADDRIEIAEMVVGIGLYSDLREWDRVASCFAPDVTTDYTSVFGGEIVKTTPKALISQWKSLLPGFDATQHQITNIIVEPSDSGAVVRSHVRATHRLDARYWTLGGSYTHRLIRTSSGWGVTYLAIQRLYEEGDRAILQIAAARVKGL